MRSEYVTELLKTREQFLTGQKIAQHIVGVHEQVGRALNDLLCVQCNKLRMRTLTYELG